jgi:hypothetical protein
MNLFTSPAFDPQIQSYPGERDRRSALAHPEEEMEARDRQHEPSRQASRNVMSGRGEGEESRRGVFVPASLTSQCPLNVVGRRPWGFLFDYILPP